MDMPERTLLNMAQIAQKLGHTLDWFYRNRARLEREQGFPKSVLGCGKRWDPTAIDRWLDSQIPPALRPPISDQAAKEAEREEIAAELRERTKAIVAGLKKRTRRP